MILIISNKWDITVDFVVKELRSRGAQFLRINTEDLSSRTATATLPQLSLTVNTGAGWVDLSQEVKVIWNRRPGYPCDDLPYRDRPPRHLVHYINSQWQSWLEILELIPGVTWVNHPQAGSIMENKARQLLYASRLGFQVPSTVLTNAPRAVFDLFDKTEAAQLVAKALYSPLIEEDEQDFFIFTNLIDREILSSAESEVRVCPSIFQEALLPKVDYRVTVIGSDVLSARIESKVDSASRNVDWRAERDGIDFVGCALPADIETLCREYVARCGLLFGAIDLIEYLGQFYFLEINPNGEWGWLQKPHGLPIAESLSKMLMEFDNEK